MASSKKSVTVRIQDQNFLINTDASPERVEKIAELVDGAMAQVLTRSKNVSPYSAAILVALNMAEKYLDAVENQDEFKETVSEKSKKILDLLESAGQKAES